MLTRAVQLHKRICQSSDTLMIARTRTSGRGPEMAVPEMQLTQRTPYHETVQISECMFLQGKRGSSMAIDMS
nr:hypothetical protein CFP56_71726 [Quercus suber]